MLGHDIIVVGASAGGVEALIQLVAELPAELSAAIFVVMHFPAHGKSRLPQILSDHGALPAAHAVDHEAIIPGRIYVAPPDSHLLIKRGYVRLIQGPKENGFRPAIDPLFRTAAKSYGRRVVGVVLSGAMDDGTAGLVDVKYKGGIAVVQDPDEALFSSMPRNAIERAQIDYVSPIKAIAPLLVELSQQPVSEEGVGAVSDTNAPENEMEPDIVELDGAAMRNRGKPGTPSSFICPDCGGTLYQMHDRNLVQFRCRIGHAWSSGSLVAGQAEAQEDSLWTAIRFLEERADLLLRLATYAKEHNQLLSSARYETQARDVQRRADIIRQTLFQGQLPITTQLENSSSSDSSSAARFSQFPIIVFAAAEGGLNAFSHILPALPPDLAAAVIVVQKLDTQSSTTLIEDAVFRPTVLPLKHIEAGDLLQPGIVYVASPNEHVLVEPDGKFNLTQAALVDFARPSVDLLLQSAAARFRERVIAVILSGQGNEGMIGVQAVHRMGGKIIVQDEADCEFFEMPNAALQTGVVDSVLPLTAIAATLVDWVASESEVLNPEEA